MAPEELAAQAAHGGDPRELGDCVLRIPAASARESHRLRPAFARPTENHSGNHHHVCLRGLYVWVHAPVADAGFSLGWVVLSWGRVFHVSRWRVSLAINAERLQRRGGYVIWR